MIRYTFIPSVVKSETEDGKYDVGCKVVYIGDDNVERFVEHSIWLAGISDFDTAREFAHQACKFMLSTYERTITNLVERMMKDEPATGFNAEIFKPKPEEQEKGVVCSYYDLDLNNTS